MKTYSPMHTITTTAKREVQILLLKKGVIVTLVIMLLAILGMIGFGTWMKNKDEAEAEAGGPAVATVGIAEQLLDATPTPPPHPGHHQRSGGSGRVCGWRGCGARERSRRGVRRDQCRSHELGTFRIVLRGAACV